MNINERRITVDSNGNQIGGGAMTPYNNTPPWMSPHPYPTPYQPQAPFSHPTTTLPVRPSANVGTADTTNPQDAAEFESFKKFVDGDKAEFIRKNSNVNICVLGSDVSTIELVYYWLFMENASGDGIVASIGEDDVCILCTSSDAFIELEVMRDNMSKDQLSYWNDEKDFNENAVNSENGLPVVGSFEVSEKFLFDNEGNLSPIGLKVWKFTKMICQDQIWYFAGRFWFTSKPDMIVTNVFLNDIDFESAPKNVKSSAPKISNRKSLLEEALRLMQCNTRDDNPPLVCRGPEVQYMNTVVTTAGTEFETRSVSGEGFAAGASYSIGDGGSGGISPTSSNLETYIHKLLK
tara:strand:+ start:639 stop:1685 length:1047 start_codon:yes stop_codon:yes gene_type:complete